MRYLWDSAKAALNYMKHGVTFGEAIAAFDDPMGFYVPDKGHPERGNLIGHDATTRLLFVVHVKLLSESPPATRLISARRANNSERDSYYVRFEPTKGRRQRRSTRAKRSTRPLPPKKRRPRHEEE